MKDLGGVEGRSRVGVAAAGDGVVVLSGSEGSHVLDTQTVLGHVVLDRAVEAVLAVLSFNPLGFDDAAADRDLIAGTESRGRPCRSIGSSR